MVIKDQLGDVQRSSRDTVSSCHARRKPTITHSRRTIPQHLGLNVELLDGIGRPPRGNIAARHLPPGPPGPVEVVEVVVRPV
jgi:hypothetical protein